MRDTAKIVKTENGYLIESYDVNCVGTGPLYVAATLAEALRVAADTLEPNHEIMISNEPE